MIQYMIEVSYERCIIIHLSIPLFDMQITINEILDKELFDESDANVALKDINNIFELNFERKFLFFKDELKKIKGIDSIDINRFEIALFKGRLFKWKEIVNDIMHLLLCFYDNGDGRAELIEFEIKKEAKKQIKRAKRKLFEEEFPKNIVLYNSKDAF
jgi:hypothetical protein